VGSATYEVDAFEFFEFVVGAQMQHLTEVVSEVERCTFVDGIIVSPLGWGDNFLDLDAAF
jgi:hypothetical protein